ncbi:MAG: protein kinase, partial [Polyangiales bacterium]
MKLLERGATIAGMQVIELLGQGAFGRVYSVASASHAVPLALKVMIVDASSESMQRRFQREAEVIKRLDCAYVPKIYDHGKLHDGSPFILMEQLQGRTLGQLLAAEGGKLHWRRVLNLGVQACEALEIAHAVGVLHRDLKPDNLFVVGERDEERLKILDFGIATFVSGYTDRHGALTKTSSLVGTPYYMPPEQVRSAAIGVEADVYMLGVVLYECLTGVRPFGGETLGDLLDSVLRGEYAPVGTYAPRTPRIMTNAVQRAMSLLPKHRFSSAGAFGGALRQGRAAMSEPPPETTLRDFVDTEKPTMPASSLHVPPAPVHAKVSAVTMAAARDTDAPLPSLPQNKAGRFIAAGLVIVCLAALAVFTIGGTGSPPQTPGPLSVSLPSAEPVASVGMETSSPGEESPTMKAAAATTEVERAPSMEPEVTAPN